MSLLSLTAVKHYVAAAIAAFVAFNAVAPVVDNTVVTVILSLAGALGLYVLPSPVSPAKSDPNPTGYTVGRSVPFVLPFCLVALLAGAAQADPWAKTRVIRPYYRARLEVYVGVSVPTALLPWRRNIEQQLQNMQRQQQAPAPAAPAPAPIIIVPPAQQHHYYLPGAPKQILDPSGQPKQILDPSGQPKQILDPSGQPKQILDPSGKPKQDLTPEGQPKQILDPNQPPAGVPVPAPQGAPRQNLDPSGSPAAPLSAAPPGGYQRYTRVHALSHPLEMKQARPIAHWRAAARQRPRVVEQVWRNGRWVDVR